jgi:hypothetical protein
MHGLSAQELLRIWEVAQGQHLVDQALTILAVAVPELSREELLTLSIGQRDTYLLAVRERTFGPQLTGTAECGVCQERLEFAFDVAGLCDAFAMEDTGVTTNQEHEVTIQGYRLRFRLPNSLDLARIAACRDIVTARNLLIQQCVEQCCQESGEVVVTELPEQTIGALAEHMAQCDPRAEIQLDLSCPACGQGWLAMLDIVSFFWTEIRAQAIRLLREVHTLARAYGWREVDILSMSAARRQLYLEMVS